MNQVRCRACLFDMDGTLVDSTAVVEHTWSIWAERNGVPLPTLLEYSHGRPTIATMNFFRPGHDWQGDAAQMMRIEESETAGTRPIAGALELLTRLPADLWAVVTSAPRKLAEGRIQAAGLPLPRVLVPVDEIERGKPDPEGYLKAATALRIAPLDCVVFEDTRPGVEAGLAAGMQVIGLLTTVSVERLGCKFVIRDYRDLTLVDSNGRFTFTIANQ